MKVFDLSELKKTARVKQSTTSMDGTLSNNNRSYSDIHKSPTKSSIREPLQESYYLSRWGKNIDGKQTSKGQNTPWANVGQGIISTSVGQDHVLIVNNKYQCFGYGSNVYGQLSLEGDHIHRPTQLSCFKEMKIVKIVSGSYHSFVQNSKGQVYGFGLNMKGQLGIGTFQNRKKPSLIFALLPNGSKNPKSNFFIQTTEYKKKLKKTKQEGSQLANITNIINKISQNSCDKPQFLLNQDEVIKDMACGPVHSLMLSNKNRIFACGYGQKYALGIGKTKSSNEFIEVKIKGNPSKIEKIQCGISVSGFLSQGKVYIAGTLDNKIFQFFTPIPSTDEIVDFKFASQCLLILSRKGQVYKLGKSSSNSSSSQTFQKISDFDSPIKQIFSGLTCFFAVSDTGACYGWGQNSNNQITGINSESQIETPKILKIPIYLNQSVEIVSGNGATFLLSGKPLESPSKVNIVVQNEEQISSFVEEIPLKTSVSEIQLKRKNTSKYSHSNIYKTQEQNLLNQMGIKPRKFNISMEIDFNDLVIQSQISQGGYGIIYKGLWRQTTVAIKMFKIQSQNGVKDFFSECAAMEALRHPNIVMFLGACTKPPNFAIVLQYCGKGSLWSTIQNLQLPLTWQDRRRFALETAKGVNYLHTSSPPIIHRDLKSLNLLLDDSYRVKLADFGWTKGLDNYMTGKIGTYQWMAPEVIASQKYSQKADVFSYGIILWEIASRQPPFKNLSGLQVSMEVLNNDLRPKIPKNTPQSFVRLMKKCWDREPSKRPSFKEIIKQLQSMKF